MSTNNIIRAWKNPAYRATLSAAERAALPPNPAGTIELAREAAGRLAAGDHNVLTFSIMPYGGCCA